MSTKQILALLNSHIDGDEDQLLSITLQIAAQEARQGRPEEAEKLKRLVQKARDQRRTGTPTGGQTPIPLARSSSWRIAGAGRERLSQGHTVEHGAVR